MAIRVFPISETSPRRRPCTPFEIPRQPPEPLGHVGLVDDGVTAVDRLGAMPRDLHRDRARHTGAFEVVHGGAAQVMKQPARTTSFLAGDLPGACDVADLLAISMEDKGHDPTFAFLHFLRVDELALD